MALSIGREVRPITETDRTKPCDRRIGSMGLLGGILIKGPHVPSDRKRMAKRTTTRSVHRSYESPTGSLVRYAALGAAIAISLVAGVVVVMRGDMDTQVVWLVWTLLLLLSILIYSVASFLYRHDTFGQSKRMQRWLHSGSR